MVWRHYLEQFSRKKKKSVHGLKGEDKGIPSSVCPERTSDHVQAVLCCSLCSPSCLSNSLCWIQGSFPALHPPHPAVTWSMAQSPESAISSVFTEVCLSLMSSWRHWQSAAQELLQRPRHLCRDPGIPWASFLLSVCCSGAGRQRNCWDMLGEVIGLALVCFRQDSGLLVFRRFRLVQVLAASSSGPIRKLFLRAPLGVLACF